MSAPSSQEVENDPYGAYEPSTQYEQSHYPQSGGRYKIHMGLMDSVSGELPSASTSRGMPSSNSDYWQDEQGKCHYVTIPQ